MDPRKSNDNHKNENKKEQKELIPAMDQKQAVMERTVIMAQKKNHPRAPISDTLLKLAAMEVEIENLRESSAANKIKRFYLNYRKGGLKAWLKGSKLHQRQEGLSHELEQSIERQGKQADEFKLKLAKQEKADKEALEVLKKRYTDELKKATSIGAWDEVQRLAEEAKGSQQGLQSRQERARQASIEAYNKKNQQVEKEQSELKEGLRQVALAKSDKQRGLLARVKPIAGLSKALHAGEEKQAALLKDQDKLMSVLKEQVDAQNKLSLLPKVGASALGFFKVEEKKTEVKFDQKQVDQVLFHTANNEQEEVGILLKIEPYLALTYGTVADQDGRIFYRITAFQYAVWAQNWNMWEMMLTHFKDEHFILATQQYKELGEKGTAHGKSFSLDPLIHALGKYSYVYDNGAWPSDNQYNSRELYLEHEKSTVALRKKQYQKQNKLRQTLEERAKPHLGRSP